MANMLTFPNGKRLHEVLLYSAYGWLLLSGLLHFSIDVVLQALRGRRAPGPEATLYYGLNSAYALSQVLFANLALFALRRGFTGLGKWPGVSLGLFATAAWLCLCFLFLEYPQPRWTAVLFGVLLLSAGSTS